MKKIVINANFCLVYSWGTKYLTGVGRTTLELIRALETRKNLPFKLALFCERFNHDRLQRYHFKSPQYCLPLPLKVRKWSESAKNYFPIVETFTGADLYHIPQGLGGFFYGNKTVVTLHDALAFEERKIRSEQEAFRRTAARVRGILTCSNSSKQLLLKYLNVPEEKIVVAPWGYNSEIFKVLPTALIQEELSRRFQIFHPYLFSIVSLRLARKRASELIRQYLKCTKKGYPYDLVVVFQDISPELETMIAAHPEGKRIKILKGATDEELAILYNGAICMVFPSLHEGFGLPILESMACGTPILTTNATSMPEIAENAGIYFESTEEEEIGNKLLQIAEGKFNLEYYSKLSLLQAKKFSWSRCAEITIDFYEKCLT